MNILVTDQGFSPLTHAAYGVIKTFAADTDPATITAEVFTADLIRIEFASFADGRGFTLARLLRLRGFRARTGIAGRRHQLQVLGRAVGS